MLPPKKLDHLVNELSAIIESLQRLGTDARKGEARWAHQWIFPVLARPEDDAKIAAFVKSVADVFTNHATIHDVTQDVQRFIDSQVNYTDVILNRALPSGESESTEQTVRRWLMELDRKYTDSEAITCVVPLEGLQICMAPLEVGQVRFLARHQLVEELSSAQWPDLSALAQQRLAIHAQTSDALAFAVYTGSGTYLKVERDAITAVQRLLELFWYAAPLLRPGQALRFGLYGHVASRSSRAPSFTTWGALHLQPLMERMGNGADVPALHPQELTLFDKDLQVLERLHIFQLAAQPQAAKGSLLSILHEAVHWLATAAQQQPGHRVISLATCLEVLYGSTPQGITQQISERCALSLEDTVEARLALQKEVKDLYALRSRSVHGQGSDIDSTKVDALQNLAYRAVDAFIARMDWFQNREAYMAHFERWKMGETPTAAQN